MRFVSIATCTSGEPVSVDARPCLSISYCLTSLVRAMVPPYVDVSAVSAWREGRHGQPREGQAGSSQPCGIPAPRSPRLDAAQERRPDRLVRCELSLWRTTSGP